MTSQSTAGQRSSKRLERRRLCLQDSPLLVMLFFKLEIKPLSTSGIGFPMHLNTRSSLQGNGSVMSYHISHDIIRRRTEVS